MTHAALFFFFHTCALLALRNYGCTALSSAEASLCYGEAFVLPLCVMGRFLCSGEAGEKEKESARGTFYFFFMGIPSGSLCGGERVHSIFSSYHDQSELGKCR